MMDQQNTIDALERVSREVRQLAALIESGNIDEALVKARLCSRDIEALFSEIAAVPEEARQAIKQPITGIHELGQQNLDLIRGEIERTSKELKQLSQSKKALANLQVVATPETRAILDYQL